MWRKKATKPSPNVPQKGGGNGGAAIHGVLSWAGAGWAEEPPLMWFVSLRTCVGRSLFSTPETVGGFSAVAAFCGGRNIFGQAGAVEN